MMAITMRSSMRVKFHNLRTRYRLDAIRKDLKENVVRVFMKHHLSLLLFLIYSCYEFNMSSRPTEAKSPWNVLNKSDTGTMFFVISTSV